MSQYAALDDLLLQAIAAGRSPLYYGPCIAEAKRIAAATGREDFRVIDGRLQAMRKAGKIVHGKHATKSGTLWHVAA